MVKKRGGWQRKEESIIDFVRCRTRSNARKKMRTNDDQERTDEKKMRQKKLKIIRIKNKYLDNMTWCETKSSARRMERK